MLNRTENSPVSPPSHKAFYVSQEFILGFSIQNSMLYLDTNDNGHFVFTCRECDYEESGAHDVIEAKVSQFQTKPYPSLYKT